MIEHRPSDIVRLAGGPNRHVLMSHVLMPVTELVLKKSISIPYNFQHLTHTGAQQAHALRTAHPDEIVSEFSALRAAQTPQRELQGIKAEALVFPPLAGGTGSPRSVRDAPAASVTSSPARSRAGSSANEPSGLRHSQSTDSFTRLASRSFSSPTPPISPPPRRSSRTPLSVPIDRWSSFQDSPTAPAFGPGVTDNSAPSSSYHSPSSFSPLSATRTESVDGEAHAVTTPDDSACIILSQPLRSPPSALPQVPEEEDEALHWTRNPSFLVLHSRPSTANSTVRSARSIPTSTPPREAPSSGHGAESVISDRIRGAGPDPSSGGVLPPHPATGGVTTTGELARVDSWEDDIDYCYEHAAEADCAFDWDRLSTDDEPRSSEPADTGVLYVSGSPTSSVYPYALEPAQSLPIHARQPSMARLEPDRQPGRLATGDLDGSSFSSTVSSAVTVPGVVTPVDGMPSSNCIHLPRTSSGSIAFPLSPSFVIPHDYASRLAYEDTDDPKMVVTDLGKPPLLPAYAHYLETNAHRDYSPRSSSSPTISKCNSQDSMLALGPVPTGPRHRHGSSAGSLPDLVPSRHPPREKANGAADLVHQIAALNVAENREGLSLMIEAKRQDFLRQAHGDDLRLLPRAPSSLGGYRDRSQSDAVNRLLPVYGTAKTVDGGALAASTRSASVVAAAAVPNRSKTVRSSYTVFPMPPVVIR